jgi:hypothetical protein
MTARFYFTLHPGDLMRSRIMPGSSIMLVASAFWNEKRNRFDILRPYQDLVQSFCIDSGGFTAARRWGCYPWTIAEYVRFIREESASGVPLDFCAILDYACEPSVDRSTYATNLQRIEATIRNEQACREEAPELPWLPVLQGDSLAEREYDLERRQALGLLPETYAGVGSVCGRSPAAASEVICFYAERLPGVRLHAFGIHIRALDDDRTYLALGSWDTYGWNWGRGQKEKNRPVEYLRQPGESYSTYTGRLARLYWANTVLPRLRKPRQGALL